MSYPALGDRPSILTLSPSCTNRRSVTVKVSIFSYSSNIRILKNAFVNREPKRKYLPVLTEVWDDL
jgi:hypothetical protein